MDLKGGGKSVRMSKSRIVSLHGFLYILRDVGPNRHNHLRQSKKPNAYSDPECPNHLPSQPDEIQRSGTLARRNLGRGRPIVRSVDATIRGSQREHELGSVADVGRDSAKLKTSRVRPS